MSAPLCINCRHCFVPLRYLSGFFSIRAVPDMPAATCRLTDKVDGSGVAGLRCSVERLNLGPHVCGAAGRHFEPIGGGT